MTPELLLAVQNVGLGIASFCFLAVVIFYILRRDDKRYESQLTREDARIVRDDKRLEAWQALTNTQGTQIATLIQQIGSLSTQSANHTAVQIEQMQSLARIDETIKHQEVNLIQIRSLLGDRRKSETHELERIITGEKDRH